MTQFKDPDGAPVEIEIRDLVVAGWSGRDKAGVEHHIAELKALGVPPPSRTPLYYRVSNCLLTTADRIQVVGGGTSGEAEAVLIHGADGVRVGLGSDHTDRAAEVHSVALAKQACPKPVCPVLWRHEEVAPHWDELILRSWAWIDGERTLYQEGSLAGILPPGALIDGHGGLPPGAAMLCGTLPAIGGVRPATRFEMELEDPVLGRRLAHAYDVEELPEVS